MPGTMTRWTVCIGLVLCVISTQATDFAHPRKKTKEKKKPPAEDTSMCFQNPTQKVAYVYFGYGRDLASEVRRFVGLATNVPYHDSIQVITNGPVVFMPNWVASKTCGEGSTIGFPEDIFSKTNGGTTLEDVLSAMSYGLWQDLDVVNIWGNYMILPRLQDEGIYKLILQGKVRMVSGQKVKRLEVDFVKTCRYMGETKVCVDEEGNYLCVIEIYLAIQQIRLGKSQSCVPLLIDPNPTSIDWKINGEISHSTSLTDIDLDEINTLDINVKDEKVPSR